jgi:ubiquinone/menaquinone biosynthesis C-methylase UbiE
MDAANLDACNVPEYVKAMEDYASARGLTPAERALFARHIPMGSDVLDMGVGTGRTVPGLLERSRRYVGIDYAPMMIERGRELFPGVDLRVASAADLGDFADASFDAVLFIANGLDSMSPELHAACLRESARVLRPGGSFLISRHNARGVASSIDPSMVPEGRQRLRAALLTSAATAWRKRRIIASRAFWRGAGRIDDPPFVFRVASRRATIADVVRYGFEHVETLSCTYPRRSVSLTSAWYFYAFRRV